MNWHNLFGIFFVVLICCQLLQRLFIEPELFYGMESQSVCTNFSYRILGKLFQRLQVLLSLLLVFSSSCREKVPHEGYSIVKKWKERLLSSPENVQKFKQKWTESNDLDFMFWNLK